jgi:hypothetical protein
MTPAGHIVRGETVLVPNLAPYDEHSAVAVMSRAHYVPMAEFTAPLLQDAFEACRAYFRDVQRLPATTYKPFQNRGGSCLPRPSCRSQISWSLQIEGVSA